MDRNGALLLGAIADDLTGATDLALTLSWGGMKVRQVVGVPEGAEAFGDAEAVVISLKSRTIPARQAVDQSLAAARVLLAAGAQQIFFKYCSTFDSTDEGNIGPVTEALLDLLGEVRTLACPAFLTNRRTVYKGHLFVGDDLLSDSSMKDHPLTPMRDANLVRVLGRQTRLPVSLIDISTVRAGADALHEALQRTQGVAIVDALEDTDLLAIGAAAHDLKLITGGSGVALGLPRNFALMGHKDSSGSDAAPAGRRVVLAGSCSAATLGQVELALASGMPGFRIDPLEVAEGRSTPSDAVAFAAGVPTSDVPVIYASNTPAAVAAVQAKLGRERAGAVVEAFLAETAKGLADRGFDRILVAGGESSGAVIEALGIRQLDVGAEISPGVPWMLTTRNGKSMALALKSGNFGTKDIFVSAWDKLQ